MRDVASNGASNSASTRARTTETGIEVGKSELLEFARRSVDAVRATRGGESDASALVWSDLKRGVGALACAARAWPESFEALTGTSRAGTSASTRGGAAAMKHPFQTLRGILARERVPANAISVDGVERGEFQATFDALAVMYWTCEVRANAASGAATAISFARKLGPGAVAYCHSEETRARAVRLAQREMETAAKKSSRKASRASLASASEIEQKREPNARETKQKRKSNEPIDGRPATMTIDDWETITELRWELEKINEISEERAREIERLRGATSPRSTRLYETKIRDLSEQLVAEHEERMRVTREYEDELIDMRKNMAEIMNASILRPENMVAFNSVDVSTEEGRAMAKVMIDAMDRVTRATADVQKATRSYLNHVSDDIVSPSTNDTSLSPSFLSRLDTFELSESSVKRAAAFDQSDEIEHFTTVNETLKHVESSDSIYDTFESASA